MEKLVAEAELSIQLAPVAGTGDTACNAPQNQQDFSLPFFVDRTGTNASGSAEVATCAQADANSAAFLPSEAAVSKSRRRRRKHKQNDGVEGADCSSSSSSVANQIGSAKQRVMDRLRQLANVGVSGESDSGTAAPGRSREIEFLQSINDQLRAEIVKNKPNEAVLEANSDNNDVDSSVSLGVKATAHHAPAFKRVHGRDLAEFLVDMRADKELWQVDAEDLLPRQQQQQQSIDPMQAECSICLKRGHPSDQCSRTGPVCILCGREGHPKTACPHRLCPLCLTSGHRAEACHRYGLLTRAPCDRCGALGHWKDQCPDIWRQYHSTVLPGCPPVQPQHKDSQLERNSNKADDTKSLATDSGQLSVDSIVGQVSQFVFCCNCAQRGHLVHQCSQPPGSLNKCVGSFHSQLVSRYDITDKFSLDSGSQLAGVSAAPAAPAAAAAAAAAAPPSGTSAGSEATGNFTDESRHGTSDPAPDANSSRPPARVGEAFIPLLPRDNAPAAMAAVAAAAASSFRAELDQLRAMARRLLPDGTSRSQVKKLANKLRYWRRHGYQPSTPEEEAQMAQRMEAWVLEVADSHNYLHKLNFKRRCRLLNSTGAALEVIRSCRQFADSAPAASASGRQSSAGAGSGRRRQRRPNKKKANKNNSKDTKPRQLAEPTVASAKKASNSKRTEQAGATTVWSGRLRARQQRQAIEGAAQKLNKKSSATKATRRK